MHPEAWPTRRNPLFIEALGETEEYKKLVELEVEKCRNPLFIEALGETRESTCGQVLHH